MKRVQDESPYTPPQVHSDPSEVASPLDRRFLYLLLPPFIPFAVHGIVRIFIPSDEILYHALFTLGAMLPAWIWSQTMIDRLRWSFWKSYLLACCIGGAVLASAILSPKFWETLGNVLLIVMSFDGNQYALIDAE